MRGEPDGEGKAKSWNRLAPDVGFPLLARLRGTALALALTSAACAPNTGHIRLAHPHVYDSETAREELAASGERVTEKIRRDADLKTIQEASAQMETTALSLRAGGQGAAPGQTPGTPTLPAAATVQNAAVGGVVAEAAKTFGRTIDEQVNDILHAENQALGAHLLYSGKGDTSRGDNSRVYLIRFDIGLLPTRQEWYTYPWWGLRTVFGSVYRFTQGWSASVNFELPSEVCNEQGLIYAYDIDPRFGVATALDAVANVNQLQLAASYLAPGGAAALDYLNRIEEQFAQQRRYPLQLGLIDGACRFSWVFGPRRFVQKRGPERFIPFVSNYTVQSRLEPGTRSGQVVLVVPSQKKLSDAIGAGNPSSCVANQATPNDERDLVVTPFRALGDQLDRFGNWGSSGEVATGATREAPDPKRVARLCLTARADYIELDRPDSYVPIPVSSADGRGATKQTAITLDLPLTPPPEDKGGLTLKLGTVTGDSVQVTLAPAGGSISGNKKPTVVLRDEARNEPLAIQKVDVTPDRTSVSVLALLPRKPESGSQVPIGATVESDGSLWKTAKPEAYSGPPWGPGPVELRCSNGSSVGSIVQLRLHGFSASAIDHVDVGLVPLTPGASTAGWAVVDGGQTVQFAVPRQPKKNGDVEPPKDGSAVDVSVFLKDKRVYRPAGGLVYSSTKRCLP